MNPEIRRGEEAQQLLQHPLFVEAFEKIESAILDSMRRVDVGAADAQRDLIVTLQLLGKVKRHIQTVAETGKMAALAEQQEEQRQSWLGRLKRRA